MKNIPGADIRTVNMRGLTSGVLHTKFWIVDKKHIYIGSANMDWRSLTQVHTHTHTHENYVRTQLQYVLLFWCLVETLWSEWLLVLVCRWKNWAQPSTTAAAWLQTWGRSLRPTGSWVTVSRSRRRGRTDLPPFTIRTRPSSCHSTTRHPGSICL